MQISLPGFLRDQPREWLITGGQFQSGAKATAVQTLRARRAAPSRAKRLDRGALREPGVKVWHGDMPLEKIWEEIAVHAEQNPHWLDATQDA